MTCQLQGNPVKLTADFSAETTEARTQWDNIENAQRKEKKTCQLDSSIQQSYVSKMKVKCIPR